MKKIALLTIAFIIVFGGLFLTSCNDRELTNKERSEIAHKIENRVLGYTEACMELDENYMKRFWADTSDFLFAGDGIITTNEEWRAKLNGLFDENI